MKHYSERALLTDLYEMTMLPAYFSRRMNDIAVFEFFVRQLPASRNFLMAAGLAQVLHYLNTLSFDEDDLRWLRESGQFDAVFIDSLKDLRFTGDVDALPEGTLFFTDTPVLRITAPLREAQLIESRLMNLLHFQTLIASKAARCVIAAQGKQLVDFGLRRSHGAEAAVLSARAAYLAGFDGTATAVAAPLFEIPVFGTMAHSFVQAHDYETDAFANFAQTFPHNATLLIDTFDTEAAAQQVVRLAQWLEEEDNIHIKAVRIDSGDLEQAARRVRQILDAGGCQEIGIFVSGNLHENSVQSLVDNRAPIDGFGVGTHMNTSNDAPFLECAYKLVAYAGQPCRKRSENKMPWPGAKQIFRQLDAHGSLHSDTLGMAREQLAGQALLTPVVRDGKQCLASPSMAQMRRHAQAGLASLTPALRMLTPVPAYPVKISEGLRALAQQVDAHQQGLAQADRARWGFNVE